MTQKNDKASLYLNSRQRGKKINGFSKPLKKTELGKNEV
jgi:hypothetical protein